MPRRGTLLFARGNVYPALLRAASGNFLEPRKRTRDGKGLKIRGRSSRPGFDSGGVQSEFDVEIDRAGWVQYRPCPGLLKVPYSQRFE
jgi:hypothetical protein